MLNFFVIGRYDTCCPNYYPKLLSHRSVPSGIKVSSSQKIAIHNRPSQVSSCIVDCYSKIEADENDCGAEGDVWFNYTCLKKAELMAVNITEEICKNVSSVLKCENVTSYPDQEYWLNETKKQVSSSEEYFK